MSDQAKAARAAMKAKVKRLVSGEPHAKVDASSWTPPEMMNTGAKTGMRPVSPRQYKRGGKVTEVHGKDAHHHAGRARHSGARLRSPCRCHRPHSSQLGRRRLQFARLLLEPVAVSDDLGGLVQPREPAVRTGGHRDRAAHHPGLQRDAVPRVPGEGARGGSGLPPLTTPMNDFKGAGDAS